MGQSYHHTEIRQLICAANHLSGFCMMATLAFNRLVALKHQPHKTCFRRQIDDGLFECLTILWGWRLKD